MSMFVLNRAMDGYIEKCVWPFIAVAHATGRLVAFFYLSVKLHLSVKFIEPIPPYKTQPDIDFVNHKLVFDEASYLSHHTF